MIEWKKGNPTHSKPVIVCELISIQWKNFYVMKYYKNEWWYTDTDIRFRGKIYCWGEINHPNISNRRRIPSF